jgi:hypothetical protein
MDTTTDIIGLWPNAASLADELGVSVITVRSWKQRNSIPPGYWLTLVASAKARGIDGVTLTVLAGMAERSIRQAQPAPPPANDDGLVEGRVA